MILTLTSVDKAMKGNNFWMFPKSREAQVIDEATKQGFVLRLSHTQVQWKDEKAIEVLKNSIQFKIEAKKHVCIYSETFENYLKISNDVNMGGFKAFKELYKTFFQKAFLLPYQVKKLSKRARRNKI